jgi:hypothetical protein
MDQNVNDPSTTDTIAGVDAEDNVSLPTHAIPGVES